MKVLEKLKGKVEGAELYEIHSEIMPVKFKAGELESAKVVERAGRALRVIKDGRIGYSTSTDLKDDEGLIKNALESAQFGDKVAFQFPKKEKATKVKTYDSEVEHTNEKDLIKIGEELVARVKDYNEKLTTDVELTRRIDELLLVNSSGHELKTKQTFFDVGIMTTRTEEGDIFVLYDSDSSRSFGRIDYKGLADSIIERLKWAERLVKIESKPMPVIFTPRGVMVLLLPLMVGFNGKSVFLGTSPVRDKLNQVVFDKRLSLIDDGTMDFASRSYGYDDEGVPTTKKDLIKDGEVKQFLYDLKTAGMAATKPTGNGFKERGLGERDFKDLPRVSPATWLVAEGEVSFEEMVAEIEEGLIVDQVIGLGQGNIMAGEFSNNVAVGYKVEKGQIVGRVKNTMIAGNVYDLLKDKVRAIGDRAEWAYGIFKAPAICIDAVSVVGK